MANRLIALQAEKVIVADDHPLFRTAIKEALQESQGETTFLEASSFETLQELVDQNQDIDLVLAGARGWLYDEIFSLVKNLGLIDRVHFTGYVQDEELPFWYNAAKVLVFPSVYEGFGMPIIEAMACGTPVIAARSSSIPEAGGEAALYFDPHDVETLTQQLAEIFEDENQLLEMRQSGFTQARKFSWDQAAEATAQVLRDAAGLSVEGPDEFRA